MSRAARRKSEPRTAARHNDDLASTPSAGSGSETGSGQGRTAAHRSKRNAKKAEMKNAQMPPHSAGEKAGTEDVDTGDGRVVIQIRVRRPLRRIIKQHADHADETVQTFILRILQEAGLPVTDDDLLDLRKGENRVHRRSSAMLSQGSKGDAPIPNGQSLEEILAAALARAASDKVTWLWVRADAW
jgi:hypothetical protein